METTPQLVASVSNESVECCPESNVENANSSTNTDPIDSCTFREVCQQTFSHSFIDLKTLLPVEKDLTKATWPTQSFIYTFFDEGPFSHLSLDTFTPYPTPPIFLLNSTFLN